MTMDTIGSRTIADRYWRRSWRRLCIACGLALCSAAALAQLPSTIRLGGSEDSIGYVQAVLAEALDAGGHEMDIRLLPQPRGVPMPRQELMLQRGDISVLMLGRTAERDSRFLPVPVGMTDNLVSHRILFIPKGRQPQYDAVHTLEQFRRLGKVADMGEAWGDRLIWELNGLPVETLSGDWRRLYRMLESADRGVTYLPRGAHEISREWWKYPELEVEQHLAFVYAQDHILYVAPQEHELQQLLSEVINQAHESGLIRKLIASHFAAVFEPPINLHQRRLILLRSDLP